MYAALLSACENCGHADKALALLGEAGSNGVAPSQEMFGAVVRCCARSARPADAEAAAAVRFKGPC